MNNDLISREALKKALKEAHTKMELTFDIASFGCVMNIIDNAPTVNPCNNCDLYFKAMTKEEMKKGGAK